MRAYEAAVFLDFEPSKRGRAGFALVFPLLLGAALVEWCRASRSPESRLITLMLCCVLWVLAMVLFVDGAEGNRMRFPTEPFLFLLFAWGLVGAFRRPRTGAA